LGPKYAENQLHAPEISKFPIGVLCQTTIEREGVGGKQEMEGRGQKISEERR
jgi:hypothetical protein